MITLEAIDHVQITVAAEVMEATLGFYEKVIGLRRIAKTNSRTGGWFELDGFQLHVGGEDVPRVDGSAGGGTSRSPVESKRHVCFRVADLAAAERAMRDANVAIIADKDPAPGWSRFYVRDPGGNRVEIAQKVDVLRS